jgi:PAS domain S-box-containing protein
LVKIVGSDEQLRAIVDAIPASIAYVDRDRIYRVVNAAYRTWFGDVTGKHVRDVIGRYYESARPLIERALRGERASCDCRMPCPDGVVRWVRADYVPDLGDDGQVRGYTLQLLDIGDHKRAQDRLSLLVEASTLLAASVDQDATAQAIATAANAALGDWSAVYIDRFSVLAAKCVAHGKELSVDEAWQRARAFAPSPACHTTVESNHLVVPLLARGKRLAVLVIGTREQHTWTHEDIELATELGRRASTSLDVARLFEQQRRTNAQLREADRRKDELLAIVSHELRNPLAPIVTALDVMEYRGLSGFERERAIIRRQAMHMSRLVDDLLDVTRIRRGKIVLQKKPLELHTIIAKAIELTSALLEQRCHQLTVDVPRELVVEADDTRLVQVFANLLTNAAKYTPPRGHIAVAATRRADTISIAISDDGPGITPELLAEIFEPFVQGDHTLQRAEGGLGLGLALVRSLTELHGGTVTAASDGPGRGARFTIELPAHQVVAPKLGRGSAQMPSATGARLLLVDDNADSARALADLLREFGYDVAVAHDAPAALLIADEFRPEIALLDIGLPVMDGYELARHLRARLPAPPRLVAVTGYGDGADSARSRDAGFEVHLGKPLDFDKLLSVLGSLSPS